MARCLLVGTETGLVSQLRVSRFVRDDVARDTGQASMIDREATFAEVWSALPWMARARLWFRRAAARKAFDRAMSTWHPLDRGEFEHERYVWSDETVAGMRWNGRAEVGFDPATLWLLSLVIQILVRWWFSHSDEAMKELRG